MTNNRLSSWGMVAAMALSGTALAQTATAPSHASAPAAMAPKPKDPLLLPSDIAPAPLADQLAPPNGNPPPPPDTTATIPLKLALEAAQAAIDTCSAQGLRIGVAVTNSAGQLQIGLTADGAPPGRIFMGARKSLTAVTFREPTSAVQAKLRTNDATALSMLTANMAVYPGAVPVMAGDKLLGAIGASGASSAQDEACSAAGAAKIKGKLK